MTIDFYFHPVSGPCRAVLMTAEIIGVKFNKKLLDLLEKKEQLNPEFVEINPQHCVPTIDDDGFVLWESRAIQTYLLSKYAPDSPLYPKDPQARAIVDRLLYFDLGNLTKTQADYLYPQLLKGEPADPEKYEALKKSFAFLECFLEKTPYVAGDHMTLADISILATLTSAEAWDISFSEFPRISEWMQKMKAEVPSYKELNEVPLKHFKEIFSQKLKKQ